MSLSFNFDSNSLIYFSNLFILSLNSSFCFSNDILFELIFLILLLSNILLSLLVLKLSSVGEISFLLNNDSLLHNFLNHLCFSYSLVFDFLFSPVNMNYNI